MKLLLMVHPFGRTRRGAETSAGDECCRGVCVRHTAPKPTAAPLPARGAVTLTATWCHQSIIEDIISHSLRKQKGSAGRYFVLRLGRSDMVKHPQIQQTYVLKSFALYLLV